MDFNSKILLESCTKVMRYHRIRENATVSSIVIDLNTCESLKSTFLYSPSSLHIYYKIIYNAH